MAVVVGPLKSCLTMGNARLVNFTFLAVAEKSNASLAIFATVWTNEGGR